MQDGYTRLYAYLAKWHNELVKVTVAVRCKYKKYWYCKQVAVHGIDSDICYVREMSFNYITGYCVMWHEIDGFYKKYNSPEDWERYYEWFEAEDKYYDPQAYLINKEFIDKFSEFQYSGYQFFQGSDIIKFLRYYREYPQVEYLMKLGLEQYVFSKTILRKVANDKHFCKWFAKNRIQLASKQYHIPIIIKAYKENKNIDILEDLFRFKNNYKNNENAKEMLEYFDGQEEKLLAYIEKNNTNMALYLDYYSACKYLNLDMNLSKNLLPHDFMRWHDIRIDEMNTMEAEKDRKQKQEFYNKFEKVAEKYTNLQTDKGEYAVIIAKSPFDLVKEGEALNHCVGRMNYDQKFVREESLIFFIRNKDSITTPYITLEYSIKNKEVLQCYGEHDSNPNKEVIDFVENKWLPYANKQIRKIA